MRRCRSHCHRPDCHRPDCHGPDRHRPDCHRSESCALLSRLPHAPAVTAALDEVFADMAGDELPEDGLMADESSAGGDSAAEASVRRAQALEGLMVARLAAMASAEMGASPAEALLAAREASGLAHEAYLAGRMAREKALRDAKASGEDGEDEETAEGMAALAEAAVVAALKERGATIDAATAAARAVRAAIRMGARASEALAAGMAAEAVLEECGAPAAELAGRSALLAVRAGHALETALTASEAVCRCATKQAVRQEDGHAPIVGPLSKRQVVFAATLSACELAAQQDALCLGPILTALDGKLRDESWLGGSIDGAALTETARAAGYIVAFDEFKEEIIFEAAVALEARAEANDLDESTEESVRAAERAAQASLSLGGLRFEILRAAEAACLVTIDPPMDAAAEAQAEATDSSTPMALPLEPRASEAMARHAGRAAARAAKKTANAGACIAAGRAAAAAFLGGFDDEMIIDAAGDAGMATVIAHAAAPVPSAAAAVAVASPAGAKPAGTTPPPSLEDTATSSDAVQRVAAISAGLRAARHALILQKATAATSAKAPDVTAEQRDLATARAIASNATVAQACALVIGHTMEEGVAAVCASHAVEAPWNGTHDDQTELDEDLDSLVAAAMVAAHAAHEGSSPELACRQGTAAAASVAEGATLAAVQEAARAAVPEIPGWSLESWLTGMNFDHLVSEAVLKRVRAKVPEGASTRKYEQAFVVKLGERGSADTVLALLKETPLLRQIAEKICEQATELAAELASVRAEAERERQEEERKAEEARRMKQQASRQGSLKGESLLSKEARAARSSSTRRWTRLNLHRKRLADGDGADLADVALGKQKSEKALSAEELNEQAKKSGAFTLSYSTDASLYWGGLKRLTGPPVDQTRNTLDHAMAAEHTQSADSDEPFETGNYGLYSTSRIEWAFVVADNHDTAREELGIDEWPGTERGREHGIRMPQTMADFDHEWQNVNRKLQGAGEQDLSAPEFISLRLYTGPMFMKYNAVLRAHCGVHFLEQRFSQLCQGNTYATSLHVLTAAIIKLGKIVRADLVYRAPGGALPKSFWHKQPEGMQGGLELAFMSTTTHKSEAMAYARRAPGMILFEVHQGFVARGASISWLSQYPNEASAPASPFASSLALLSSPDRTPLTTP